MDINKDFHKPDQHPFGMLEGYKQGYEKESVLYFIFKNCWLHDDLNHACATQYDHPTMVEDGLLEKLDTDYHDNVYRLTTKAIGLLYSVYGRK